MTNLKLIIIIIYKYIIKHIFLIRLTGFKISLLLLLFYSYWLGHKITRDLESIKGYEIESTRISNNMAPVRMVMGI